MKTPAEAQQITRAMLDDTISFFGGPEGWTTRSPEPADSCTVQGHEGVSYYWIQQGPGTGSDAARDDSAKRLVERLKAQGYTAYIAKGKPNDPLARVYADGGAVADFSAYISAEYINIRAESWCVTGTDTPAPTP